MADALRLYGLKAVVLAGASGIGEAISRTLVKHGAAVLALDTEASGVDMTYRSVRGVTGKGINADSDDFGASVVDAAKEELGGIDILVNYVELPQEAPINDADQDALSKIQQARESLFSSAANAAIPHLKRSPAGRIINIGFLRSVFSADGEVAYEQSNDLLDAFCRDIATEHGGDGISANYVNPGAIMTRESRPVYSAATDLRDYCIRRSAAKRLGETVDIAKVVLFLASDDADFVNGAGIAVDGGRAADD